MLYRSTHIKKTTRNSSITVIMLTNLLNASEFFGFIHGLLFDWIFSLILCSWQANVVAGQSILQLLMIFTHTLPLFLFQLFKVMFHDVLMESGLVAFRMGRVGKFPSVNFAI